MAKDQFFESFDMSVSAIIAHKMRSLLTMLGIIIGIASIVCVCGDRKWFSTTSFKKY
ncbi:hypothetical protein [Fusobacterium nucleatum]|uniref:hypothetical protein n=1 Tax=Fusobacterium nucleatum TaxID=851 RepID=UPI0030CEEAAC